VVSVFLLWFDIACLSRGDTMKIPIVLSVPAFIRDRGTVKSGRYVFGELNPSSR